MKTPEEILDKIMVEDEPFLHYIGKDGKIYELIVFAMRVMQKETLEDMMKIVGDDKSAITHQSLSQYRSAMIKAIELIKT